jgi:hypothetical protein
MNCDPERDSDSANGKDHLDVHPLKRSLYLRCGSPLIRDIFGSPSVFVWV